MHKKHFTESEKVALMVYFRFNLWDHFYDIDVKKDQASKGNDSLFDDIYTVPIRYRKKSSCNARMRRLVFFVRRGPEPQVVRVELKGLVGKNKKNFQRWKVERLIVANFTGNRNEWVLKYIWPNLDKEIAFSWETWDMIFEKNIKDVVNTLSQA